MKTVLLSCAESTLLDANTNKVSLINIFDELTSPQFPFLIPNFSVLAVTKREDGEEDQGSCTIKISLDEQIILDAPVLINYQGTAMHRAIMGLHGLVVSGPGILKVQLLYEETKIGEWLIPVSQLTPSITVNGQEG